MNESELKQNIARNITRLRKNNNLTQAELAERLSYSDKSVSKWERGDGLPDVYVLTQIAGMFGVSVNDLISESKEIEPGGVVKAINRYRLMLITALSSGLVWFSATLLYFFLKVFMPETDWLWMSFIYAIPISAIVVVVFAHLWWGILMQCLSVSALVWGAAVCIHLTMLVPNFQNIALVYAAAGVFQVLVVLWYLYLRILNRHKNKEIPAGGGEGERDGPEDRGKAAK